MSLKNKTICIIGTGLDLHLVQSLVPYFKDVLYYLPDSDTFQLPDKEQIGTGILGVTRILDLHEHIHVDPKERDVDLFFFPYIGESGLQEHLRDMGYAVAGSGFSDIMELDRVLFNKTLKKVGLPVAPTEYIKGVDNLRKHLEGKTDLYIKISKYRGLMETMHYEDSEDIDSFFDDLSCKLGVYRDKITFIVQKPIKSECEVGMDSFNLDGEHPKNSLVGIEIKDSGYLCKVFKDMPAILQTVAGKMAPVYDKLGYQGLHSNEVRITANGEAYPIDETCRMPIPPGELFPEMYEPGNFAQALWDIGNGKMPVLNPAAKYGAELIMKSSWYGEKHTLTVRFPKEIAQFVKLRNYCIVDGSYKVIPNDNDGDFGAVVATGNTPDEAISLCLERAKLVKGYRVTYENGVFDDAKKAFEASAKWGIAL